MPTVPTSDLDLVIVPSLELTELIEIPEFIDPVSTILPSLEYLDNLATIENLENLETFKEPVPAITEIEIGTTMPLSNKTNLEN